MKRRYFFPPFLFFSTPLSLRCHFDDFVAPRLLNKFYMGLFVVEAIGM